MPAANVRTATYLFTDIEGSTRLWQEHREAMTLALAAHDAIMRAAVEGAGGTVVKTTGDGLLATFDRAEFAVTAALEGQRAMRRHEWPDTGPLRVRMAIHSGSAESRDGDLFGPALNRAARLLAIGHGGQVLVSGATAGLMEDDLPAAVELIDRGDHRLRDLDQPEHVFQLVASDLPREFPPLASIAAHQTNLPIQLTSFVPRERELGAIPDLLASGRLVTLVGVGGTGKTRLMVQVAADVLDRYRDGAWLVELAAVSDPGLVLQEVARALGVEPQPGQALTDTVIDFLRSKELLLLLDNCEHVIESAADLVHRLLASSPTLTVLATSREPLGIGGEAIFAVPSLTLPAVIDSREGHLLDPGQLETIARTEAVQLFVARAAATMPGFSLDAENASAIVDICRRLDGIPLALELAAARVAVLSVREIDARLGDRFRLLTGGRRTAVPRQQTLQALIDWSWDLLSEPDRRLLRRLSVFAGGWTLEAAAAVTSGADPPDETTAASRTGGEDVLATIDGLGRLVDRSLVVVEHGDATRYRMLETIRQYARDKLIASGESTELRTRHLAIFRRLALDAEPALQGPDMVKWLAVLDADIDNLRSALEWAMEADPEAALEISVAMLGYWRSRSIGSEGIDRLGAAVELGRALPDVAGSTQRHSVLVARVLAAAAIASATTGGGSTARGWAEESLTIARTTGDPRALSDALSAQGLARVFGASVDERDDGDLELIALSEQLGDWSRLSFILAGHAMQDMGLDPTLTGPSLTRSIDAARRSGNPAAIGFAALARGLTASRAGLFSEARSSLLEAAARYRQAGDRRFELICRSELAHALRRAGAVDEAAAEYRDTIHEWQHLGNRGAIANQLEGFAFLAVARLDGLRAARLLGAAEALRDIAETPMIDHERVEYAFEMRRLREMLDGIGLDSAWAEGRQMTADVAVAAAVAID